jgi:hypothetical protein
MKYVCENFKDIEAVRWTGDNSKEIANFVGDLISGYNAVTLEFRIATPKGVLSADLGDFIIKDSRGNFYKIEPNAFMLLYEKVGEG